MASGEAEPLQYTTTVLRVSIHCEGCKKKVKKVLHSIEGVYKVTVDASQHKVTVTASLGADALIRRLHKAGKQAALWPPAAAAPPAAAEAKKPQEVVVEAAPALPVPGESSAKEEPKPPKEAAASAAAAAKDKAPPPGPEAEGKEKKPAKEKKPDKAEAAKPNKDVEAVAEPKEEKKEKKGSSPLPGAEEAGAEEPSSGKKGGKKNKKSKAKDGGEGEEAPAPAPAPAVEKPSSTMPAPAPAPVLGVAERPHGGAFPYYAAGQPVVMSYNVAHPSSSVSYYAPTPAAALPMHPMPSQAAAMMPYGYPPPPGYYPGMVPVPELLYGPPGMRSSYPSPPQESYNSMFNEENANSCSLM